MEMTIAWKSDPDYPGRTNRHLWLLVGGGDCFDGADAFYLGPDSDIDGEPIAESNIDSVIQSAKSKGIALNVSSIRDTLDEYRRD